MSLFDRQIQDQTTNINQLSTQSANSQAGNVVQSQFTPQQQAVQGQVLGGFQDFLQSGQVPGQFALPQAQADFGQMLFERDVLPNVATQFGPDSPQILNRQQDFSLGLAALAEQQGPTNFLNAMNSAAQFAFRPVGSVENRSGSQTGSSSLDETRNTNTTTQNTDFGGLLEALSLFLGGPFQ